MSGSPGHGPRTGDARPMEASRISDATGFDQLYEILRNLETTNARSGKNYAIKGSTGTPYRAEYIIGEIEKVRRGGTGKITAEMGLLSKVMGLTQGESRNTGKRTEFYRKWNGRVDQLCRSLGYNSSAHTVTALEIIGKTTDWGEKPVTDGIILEAFKQADTAIKSRKS